MGLAGPDTDWRFPVGIHQRPGPQVCNLQAVDLLRQLPGVSAGNCAALMAAVPSLAALAAAPLALLARAMGAAAAQQLHGFLHERRGLQREQLRAQERLLRQQQQEAAGGGGGGGAKGKGKGAR